jgi:hypothetical protein|tara:strand:+ start:64 stop:252 length:189 start_codon:yes stop_codon:yes gene_type:complete
MITHIIFTYFVLGFISALIVVELTDGKPAKKADFSNIEHTISNPYPIQDTPKQDTFNSQRKN